MRGRRPLAANQLGGARTTTGGVITSRQIRVADIFDAMHRPTMPARNVLKLGRHRTPAEFRTTRRMLGATRQELAGRVAGTPGCPPSVSLVPGVRVVCYLSLESCAAGRHACSHLSTVRRARSTTPGLHEVSGPYLETRAKSPIGALHAE